jgi:hypothetical protein
MALDTQGQFFYIPDYQAKSDNKRDPDLPEPNEDLNNGQHLPSEPL